MGSLVSREKYEKGIKEFEGKGWQLLTSEFVHNSLTASYMINGVSLLTNDLRPKTRKGFACMPDLSLFINYFGADFVKKSFGRNAAYATVDKFASKIDKFYSFTPITDFLTSFQSCGV